MNFQLSDVTMHETIFGLGPRIKSYIPPYKQIPDKFKNKNNKFYRLAENWWEQELNKNIRFIVKNNLSNEIIKKYINAVLHTHGSFAGRTWKIAGAAYLLSLWLEDYTTAAKNG